LALLKDVAGTKVYKQRHTESLKIMADTDTKRGKINKLLITSRLGCKNLRKRKKNSKSFGKRTKTEGVIPAGVGRGW